MRQLWHDLLFAHWPMRPADLAPLLPSVFTPDTFDGDAWIALVPFRMSAIRLANAIPTIPLADGMHELNVRTYVTINGEKGVYFFSLDANNVLLVESARLLYQLPYFRAAIVSQWHGDTLHYAAERYDARAAHARFAVRYRASGPAFASTPGSIEHWLTERYWLYTSDRQGQVWGARIDHIPWPLQPAEAEFPVNTLAQSWRLKLRDTPPLLHYSKLLAIGANPLRRIVVESVPASAEVES